MGNKQANLQNLELKNNRVAIKYVDLDIQVENKIINIQVLYGNAFFPKLWNNAIFELRQTDTIIPLNLRRLQTEPIPISKYLTNFTIQHIGSNKHFNDATAQLHILGIPGRLQSETDVYYSNDEEYREQYRETYRKAFRKINKDNQEYIAIGILDLPLNNPLIGINNYIQAIDIMQAIFDNDITLKIDKVVFMTEDINQCVFIAKSIQDNMNYLQKFIDNHQVNQVDKDIQILQDSCQDKRNAKISFTEGHKHKSKSIYFRELNNLLSLETSSEIPITSPKQYFKCLCGRQTVVYSPKTFCAYCRSDKPTYWMCQERECGRRYCSQCKYILKSVRKCQKNHSLSYKSELTNFICVQCYQRYNDDNPSIKSWTCMICQNFTICSRCFYNYHYYFQYEKVKLYYEIIRRIKPNLQFITINEIVNEHLIDMDFENLQK